MKSPCRECYSNQADMSECRSSCPRLKAFVAEIDSDMLASFGVVDPSGASFSIAIGGLINE